MPSKSICCCCHFLFHEAHLRCCKWQTFILFLWMSIVYIWSFPGDSVVKNQLPKAGDSGFDPWVRNIPWRRNWRPTPVFLPGKSHGLRSLAGYGVIRVRHDLVTKHQTFCDPMDCSKPVFPVTNFQSLLKQVYWAGDAIPPSHPLPPPSPTAFNLSQNKCPFQWVSSLQQVAKGLELQLQHQCFQCIVRTDFL